MTEGQIRFQTLREEQRHNLEAEKVAKIQAQASQLNALSKHQEVMLERQFLPFRQMESAAKTYNLRSTAESKATEVGWNIGFGIASFLLPDANTILRSGAQVVSSLFK